MVQATQLQMYHAQQAELASKLYLASTTPASDAADWREAIVEARQLIAAALRSTTYLKSIRPALQSHPGLTLVLRSLTAPPISQDQFKLKCDDWNKQKEKKNLALSPAEAAAFAATFEQYRDRAVTRWVDTNRNPTRREVRELMSTLAPYIGLQRLGTARRNRLSRIQEESVVGLLLSSGWTKIPSKLITTSASLKLKEFSHKTRFATQTRPQEVDIACGLKNTVVLAMECKVTNDRTNSVKRVNDVLKKASAWKTHWGNFVETAALLQGVIDAKDVYRLLDAGVEVFWSHDLPRFQTWLSSRT